MTLKYTKDNSWCTCHPLSKAVDIISLIELSHSVCPDSRKFLFVTVAVHTRIMDRVPSVKEKQALVSYFGEILNVLLLFCKTTTNSLMSERSWMHHGGVFTNPPFLATVHHNTKPDKLFNCTGNYLKHIFRLWNLVLYILSLGEFFFKKR